MNIHLPPEGGENRRGDETMLENSMIESRGRSTTRKPLTVLISAALHGVIVLLLVMIPIVKPQALPMLAEAYGLPLPAMPEPKTPEIVPTNSAPVVQKEVKPLPTDFVAPRAIPSDIAIVVDPPQEFAGVPVASNPTVRSLLDHIGKREDVIQPPPPPPELPAEVMRPPEPVRVGGIVQQANLIYQVKPEYPPLARQVHAQGAVLIEAIVSKDGSVRDVRIISGHPLLTEAAKVAVQQWRYKPTFLNGEPIEVITTVTVTFALQ